MVFVRWILHMNSFTKLQYNIVINFTQTNNTHMSNIIIFDKDNSDKSEYVSKVLFSWILKLE